MRNAGENQATITRMGSDPKEVSFDGDATLEEVLELGGIDNLSETETVWVNGEKAELENIIDDGDTIQIVGKKEGGIK